MIPNGIDEKDFRYNQISAVQVEQFYNHFVELLEDFSLLVKRGQLEVCLPVITRICVRIDQRKDYYMYYHSNDKKVMHMSQEKEMALWAYWVSKYKPIRFSDPLDDEYFFTTNNGCTVSDAFACYIIISIVCANNKDKVKFFTPAVVKDLYYDLSNRDFSKEAIISKVNDLIH